MPTDQIVKDALAKPPAMLRAAPAKGIEKSDSPVDRKGGDHGAGLIRGIAVVTRGEALGHGFWIDSEFLKQTAAAINASDAGIKSRFTHPGLSSDGLGKYLGRLKAGRIDGDVVRGDLHFSPVAHDAPDGDLAGYVMALAEDDPKAFATSIVFEYDRKAEGEFRGKNLDEDGRFKSPDADNVKNYPHARLKALRADDIVDQPAANPGGLFHRGDEIAKEADELLSYALGLSEHKPGTALLEVDPDRVSGFVTRFLDQHGLTVVRKKENQPMADNPATGAPAPQNKPAEVDLSKERLAALKSKYKDPDFVLEMFEGGKSMAEAETEWLKRQSAAKDAELAKLQAENAKLKEEAEKASKKQAAAPTEGADPVDFGAGTGGTVSGDFMSRARELAAERKIPINQAMSQLAAENPELHEAFLSGSKESKAVNPNAVGLQYHGIRR